MCARALRCEAFFGLSVTCSVGVVAGPCGVDSLVCNVVIVVVWKRKFALSDLHGGGGGGLCCPSLADLTVDQLADVQ